MAATVSPLEKFEAAVRVIQSLPKNGSFQPSHEMMLRFYALYKQAKFGPCTDPKPAFWDVVRKAKWDAWQKLKELSPEAAMLLYVEELKKVIETMPHTPDVSAFLEKLGSFYELVDEDEDLPSNGVPDAQTGQSMTLRDSIKKATGKMNRSRGNSESIVNGDHVYRNDGQIEEAKVNGKDCLVPATRPKLEFNLQVNHGDMRNGNSLRLNEMRNDDESDEENDVPSQGGPHQGTSLDEETGDADEEDDEEFCDVASSYSLSVTPHNGLMHPESNSGMSALAVDSGMTNLSTQILNSLSRMERDIQTLSARLESMDRHIRTRLESSSPSQVRQGSGDAPGDGNGPPRRPWWWRLTFDRLGLRNVVFIVVWPIIVQIVGRFIIRRLRSRTMRRVRALPH